MSPKEPYICCAILRLCASGAGEKHTEQTKGTKNAVVRQSWSGGELAAVGIRHFRLRGAPKRRFGATAATLDTRAWCFGFCGWRSCIWDGACLNFQDHMTAAVKGSVLISRVVLKNYKSIASCSVQLRPLIFLVGQNGSGRSNFLDALRFVGESLNSSLDHGLRERGGINEVRRRSSGHPTHFGIRLEFALPDATSGYYAFGVGAKHGGGFEVQREECCIYSQGAFEPDKFYVVNSGRVEDSNPKPVPAAAEDRLFLAAASSLPEFRPLYDCLTRMGFYDFNPEAIRALQPADTGEALLGDGSNLAGVLNLMAAESPAAKAEIVELLSKVAPGVVDVAAKHIGKKEALEFRQRAGENEAPWRFLAENMSEGTLRALGILTALLQSWDGGTRKKAPLIRHRRTGSRLAPWGGRCPARLCGGRFAAHPAFGNQPQPRLAG